MHLRSVHWKGVLDIATSLVLIGAAGLVVWFQFNPRSSAPVARTLNPPKQPLSIAGATLKGSSTAAAVLIMYSDFECPFCRRFAQDVLPKLESEYVKDGKLQMAFRHFPLPIHRRAVTAAVAAECAGRQDRFWEMHDRVFGASDLGDAALMSMATALNLQTADFDACVRDETITKKVQEDERLGRTLGIRGTPAFFLGKRLPDGTVKIERALSGAKPIDDFRSAVDSVLQ